MFNMHFKYVCIDIKKMPCIYTPGICNYTVLLQGLTRVVISNSSYCVTRKHVHATILLKLAIQLNESIIYEHQ